MADQKLAALRSLMASHSPPLHALVVPSEDYHQSEYVAPRDKRREFVSGFTGSAGLALITVNEAFLWTDGRYFLQAEQQLSDQWKLMRMGEDPVVEIWVADNLPKDAAVGVDPWCISVNTAQRWERAFAKKQQKLIETTKNLVDEVWTSRPPPPLNPVSVHPLEFTGRSVEDKLKDLREKLAKEKARAIILTIMDEIVWLYNIRGTDVLNIPLVQSYAVVTMAAAFLYVEKRKLPSEVNSYLEKNGIIVRDYGAVSSDVALLASNHLRPSANDSSAEEESGNGLILVDPATCCFALYSKLNVDKVVLQPSPVDLAKALKNPVELEGLKKAHIRDGAAVVEYLVWLDKQVQEIYGASGYFVESEVNKKDQMKATKLTEVSVSDKLQEFRASKEHFRGLSFPTISSTGPNGAIMHYSPEAETCSELDPSCMYLCDSGGQYLDGTTDITRTMHFGKPTAHEKACYTSVLKGHIGLASARFPTGTTGQVLDTLARVPLWKDGLDYRHGTGHGVGSYLTLHEGPQAISPKPHARDFAMQPSMTVTIEPGYYEDGNFGVRLENVYIIKEADTKFNFGGKGYLAFESITWAPFQRKMMDVSRLGPDEIGWLNDYHSKCREILAPYMNASETEWLKKATEPIAA